MTPPFPDFSPSRIVELDVREVIAAGREPLPTILAASEELAPGWVLHLRSPFQPVPLFTVMGERGFAHHSTMFAPDDWSTWFWREGEAVERAAPPAAPERAAAPPGSWDLRDLPPPEPLLAILARVEEAASPFSVVLPGHPAPLPHLLDGLGWTMIAQSPLPDGSVVLRMQPRD